MHRSADPPIRRSADPPEDLLRGDRLPQVIVLSGRSRPGSAPPPIPGPLPPPSHGHFRKPPTTPPLARSSPPALAYGLARPEGIPAPLPTPRTSSARRLPGHSGPSSPAHGTRPARPAPTLARGRVFEVPCGARCGRCVLSACRTKGLAAEPLRPGRCGGRACRAPSVPCRTVSTPPSARTAFPRRTGRPRASGPRPGSRAAAQHYPRLSHPPPECRPPQGPVRHGPTPLTCGPAFAERVAAGAGSGRRGARAAWRSTARGPVSAARRARRSVGSSPELTPGERAGPRATCPRRPPPPGPRPHGSRAGGG
ncbi:hypothetical protein EES47_21635 [Streptomyces sp. ADI98-12]|nr:hypothetical protein EES47_21635 [Streptomyces sp. ADI98-12]